MTRKGIDVSHWQGTIDWNKVKKAGIEFAIIKAGGSDAGFYTFLFGKAYIAYPPRAWGFGDSTVIPARLF